MDNLTLLRTIAPEFSEVPDGLIQTWLELTSQLVSETAFGTQYPQALVYLTAPVSYTHLDVYKRQS